jgi:signal transduction histidine kinase
VVGDTVRLQQVLWNLLKNASKFTPEGGEIRVTSRNETSLILVEIPDTGIGIEPELSRQLYAFTQGNEGIAREFGGLGLGLAISKATVEAHGGTLRAEKQGSNFHSRTAVVSLSRQAGSREPIPTRYDCYPTSFVSFALIRHRGSP